MITIKKNGEMIRVNTAILNFNQPTPPATLKVGFERCTVQPYVPSPLRCFKCQQFGHHQDNCSKTKVCAKCAKPDHQDTTCTSAVKCVNCIGEHTAYSKKFSRWITEKEIQRVRTERKISFPEVRKIVKGVNKQPSYASFVAKQVVSVVCQTDAVEIKSATGATNVSATPTTAATPTAPKPLANKDAKQTTNGKT